MLADFYITRLSNDMKIAVQKNHLGGQIVYRSFVPIKKTASKAPFFISLLFFKHQILYSIKNSYVWRHVSIY